MTDPLKQTPACELDRDNRFTKETNPKDSVGFNKSPMFSYIPRPVIAEVGLALMEGGHCLCKQA